MGVQGGHGGDGAGMGWETGWVQGQGYVNVGSGGYRGQERGWGRYRAKEGAPTPPFL